MPILSSLEWLQFWEARHAAVMNNVQWNSDVKRLSFDLTVNQSPGAPLAVMVPAVYQGVSLARIALDDNVVQHSQRDPRGDSYGWISVSDGAHHIVAIYV